MGSSNPCGARQSQDRSPAPAASQQQTSTNPNQKLGLNPSTALSPRHVWANLVVLETARSDVRGCHPGVLTSRAAQRSRTPRARARLWGRAGKSLPAPRVNPTCHGRGCREAMVGKVTCPQL